MGGGYIWVREFRCRSTTAPSSWSSRPRIFTVKLIRFTFKGMGLERGEIKGGGDCHFMGRRK